MTAAAGSGTCALRWLKIMDTIIIIGLFIGVLGIPIGGSIYILNKGGINFRRSLVAILFLSVPVSIILSHIRVQYNENTYAHGWPIARVVFQRDSPDGPWRDFIGWTLLLAYPLNYLALLVPLVLTCLVIMRIQSVRRGINKISQQAAPRNH
jgi:hypothetical protein